MIDPWQILILDRHTATEKDVKAAYARLLKQHRPDTDPEGFRRVREAYESALIWLRDRSERPEVSYVEQPAENQDEGGGQSGSLPVVFEDLPLPADAQEALAEVEHAAGAGNVEQLEAALTSFQERCDEGAVSGISRATALERAFQGRVKDLAAGVSDAFLLRLMDLGEMNLPHLVISAWVEEENRWRLVQLAEVLQEQARSLSSPDGAMLMSRVGMLIGLEQPETATALANAAYPHLPVDGRAQLMAQLEQEAALGRIFSDVSPEMKPFWFDRVRRGGVDHDWDSQDAMTALEDLITRNRYQWQGWGVVRQLMPEASWGMVEARLRNQAQQVANSTPRRSKFPYWIIVPAALVVINLLRFMATDKPPESPTRLTEAQQRGLAEIQRIKRAKEAEAAGGDAGTPLLVPPGLPTVPATPSTERAGMTPVSPPVSTGEPNDRTLQQIRDGNFWTPLPGTR